MLIKSNTIDKGNAFEWGRTSEDYAKFRDIYPEEFDIAHYAAMLILKKANVSGG